MSLHVPRPVPGLQNSIATSITGVILNRKDVFAALAACFAASLLAPGGSAQERSFCQQTELRSVEIGKLTGDIYYARMDDYVSVFMVTSEGIILVEPIGVRSFKPG